MLVKTEFTFYVLFLCDSNWMFRDTLNVLQVRRIKMLSEVKIYENMFMNSS